MNQDLIITRSAALLSVGIVTASLWACSTGNASSNDADNRYIAGRDELYSDDTVQHWLPGTDIPVCWVQTGFETEKQVIVDALNATWSTAGNIHFTGFGSCPTTGSTQFIRAAIDMGTDSQGGGAAYEGVGALRSPTTDTAVRSLGIALPQSGSIGRIQYLGVHEFGHIIGFTHEQDRADNTWPSDPTCNPSGSISGEFFTMFDPNSIMNYCRPIGNSSGSLSELDKLGIELLYPYTNQRAIVSQAVRFQVAGGQVVRSDDVFISDWEYRGAPTSMMTQPTWRVDGVIAGTSHDFPVLVVNNYGPGFHQISGEFNGYFGQAQHLVPETVTLSTDLHTALVAAALTR